MLEDYYGERKGVMKGGTARARGDMNLNMRHTGLARALGEGQSGLSLLLCLGLFFQVGEEGTCAGRLA